jgi:hypothetical protein
MIAVFSEFSDWAVETQALDLELLHEIERLNG